MARRAPSYGRHRPGKPSRRTVVLAVDSSHDALTRAGLDYREKHVYPHLMRRGLVVRKFQGPMARRLYVAPEARKSDVSYVTGVGHGGHDTYTGDWGSPIWQVGNYHPDEVRGKIMHLLSCETARDLGPDAVRNTCRAYFGYDENFVVVLSHPEVFFDCDSEIDRGFADGLNAARVHDHTIALYDKRIGEALAAGRQYTAAVLRFDRDHLRSPQSGSNWGNGIARLM